jgi:hypothetical protein
MICAISFRHVSYLQRDAPPELRIANSPGPELHIQKAPPTVLSYERIEEPSSRTDPLVGGGPLLEGRGDLLQPTPDTGFEFFSRRLGEDMTRRPLEHVKAAGFDVTERERLGPGGIVVRPLAVKPPLSP